MGSMSIWHWLAVLAIVLLVFGTKRLRNIGSDVGAAIRDFRKSMNDGDKPDGEGDQPSAPLDHHSEASAADKTAAESRSKEKRD